LTGGFILRVADRSASAGLSRAALAGQVIGLTCYGRRQAKV
jgi:hypothetical protein